MSLSPFARLTDVDVLITDDAPPDGARADTAEHINEVVYAEGIRRPSSKRCIPGDETPWSRVNYGVRGRDDLVGGHYRGAVGGRLYVAGLG